MAALFIAGMRLNFSGISVRLISEAVMKKICIFILTVLAVLCFTAATVQASPISRNGRLSVAGGKIVNEEGRPFVIKGVSTHGINWFPEYVSRASFRSLKKDWGANTVRLALYTEGYNGYCSGGSRSGLRKLIENGVSYAAQEGMYAIIDWHILSDGNPKKYLKQSTAFFAHMAKKYRNSSNVIYEICNEPNGSGGTWRNIRTYSKKLISTIRKYDKKAIIIVGTPTWSQDIENAAALPLKGKNLAYAFHFYSGTHKASMRARLETALKNKVPVIVSEFGISAASGNGGVYRSEGDRWITLLDRYKTGRVCWNLSNKNESSALLKSGCSRLSGWKKSDLSAEGKWLVKSYRGKLS